MQLLFFVSIVDGVKRNDVEKLLIKVRQNAASHDDETAELLYHLMHGSM
jgi:hypothetical protein